MVRWRLWPIDLFLRSGSFSNDGIRSSDPSVSFRPGRLLRRVPSSTLSLTQSRYSDRGCRSEPSNVASTCLISLYWSTSTWRTGTTGSGTTGSIGTAGSVGLDGGSSVGPPLTSSAILVSTTSRHPSGISGTFGFSLLRARYRWIARWTTWIGEFLRCWM